MTDGGEAPQDEPPPATFGPQAAPGAYAGTMVIPDEEGPLRGHLAKRITEIEEDRRSAVDEPNARERQNNGFVAYQNLSAQELPIPDDVRAAYEEWLAVQAKLNAITAHARELRKAAISVPMDMLRAMVTGVEEGWP
jgi:hypothetical protein